HPPRRLRPRARGTDPDGRAVGGGSRWAGKVTAALRSARRRSLTGVPLFGGLDRLPRRVSSAGGPSVGMGRAALCLSLGAELGNRRFRRPPPARGVGGDLRGGDAARQPAA